MKTLLLIGALLAAQVHATVVADFCAGDSEGTYAGKLGDLDVRLNFFCLDSTRPEVTVGPVVYAGEPSVDAVSNLVDMAIDNDDLIMSSFATGSGERKGGSSKSIFIYIKISLAAFLRHKIDGYYTGGTMTDFAPLHAERIGSYPKINPAAKAPLDKKSVVGVYTITSKGVWKNARLLFDVLEDIPVVSLVSLTGNSPVHFSDGQPWNNNGVFSIATPEGNGGEPDDKKLYYMRGHFLDEKHVEFYLINPALGLVGPLQAERH